MSLEELERMVATQERINGNLREDRDIARKGAKDGQQWQRSWERVIGELGELILQAKARPKGRRFVTVLELQVLLTRQGEAP